MNQIGFTILTLVLMIMFSPAWAHGTAEGPVAPANLTDESIIHRLKQLGYSDIKIVRGSGDSVDVELQREDQRFELTVSRRLVGPGSLATYDLVQVVERLLKPMGKPTLPKVPVYKGPVSPSTPTVPQ